MNSLSSSIDRDSLISSYSFVNYIAENSKRLEDVLDIAARICNVKSAFITLLGNTRQDILCQRGIHLKPMEVTNSICQFTIQGADLLEISDTSQDERVKQLGLHNSEHKMMFYAGQPLYNIDNHCIGALCVSHDQPKTLDEDQKISLSTLAANTIHHLDNQRYLMNLILKLNANYQLKNIENISSLHAELALQQQKIVDQNKLIEQQQKSLIESNESLRTFAYIAAHDIKSPARVIYSFAQLLNDKLQLNPSAKPFINYTKIIQQASNNLIKLVSSILVYADSDSKEMELTAVDLSKVLDTVKFNLGETIKASKAEINFIPTSHDVLGHKEQLIQLFQNIISNGIKYQDGSKSPIINVQGKSVKSKVVISINDNGIGIQDKDLYRIFEPFQRLHASSKYSGSGLGLSTCLRVIDNHKSHICIESYPSKGTTFTFALAKSSE